MTLVFDFYGLNHKLLSSIKWVLLSLLYENLTPLKKLQVFPITKGLNPINF